MTRLIRPSLVIFVVLLALGCAIMLIQNESWVGRSDIEVLFVLTDGETGQPISNGSVQIIANRDGFCDDPSELNFKLYTDARGQVKQVACNCMCFGTRSFFQDSFGAHLPSWTYQASAAGYVSSTPVDLRRLEASGSLKRRGESPTLLVPIKLTRLSMAERTSR